MFRFNYCRFTAVPKENSAARRRDFCRTLVSSVRPNVLYITLQSANSVQTDLIYHQPVSIIIQCEFVDFPDVRKSPFQLIKHTHINTPASICTKGSIVSSSSRLRLSCFFFFFFYTR